MNSWILRFLFTNKFAILEAFVINAFDSLLHRQLFFHGTTNFFAWTFCSLQLTFFLRTALSVSQPPFNSRCYYPVPRDIWPMVWKASLSVDGVGSGEFTISASSGYLFWCFAGYLVGEFWGTPLLF